ncbi:hypothetical protein KCU88_g3953, partial [Aureobasidium melanogenum]
MSATLLRSPADGGSCEQQLEPPFQIPEGKPSETVSQAVVADKPTPATASAVPDPSKLVKDGSPSDALHARCWSQAVKIFNEKLTKDPGKRIDLSSATSSGQHPSCTLDEILHETHRARDKFNQNYGPFRRRFDNILMAFNQYAASIDVMIQQSPHTTALVWGSIRAVIGLVVTEIEVNESVIETLATIAPNIGRWMKYLQLFPTETLLFDAISTASAHVLNYLVRARLLLEKSRRARIATASFKPIKGKLEAIVRQVEGHGLIVEREYAATAVRGQVQAIKAQAKGREDIEKEAIKQEQFRLESQDLYRRIKAGLNLQEETLELNRNMYRFMQELSLAEAERHQEELTRMWVEKILDWLSPEPCPIPAVKRAASTCSWIFDSQQYQVWTANHFSQLLWIYGIPGCGKTMLAQFLAEQSPTPITITHFFRSSLSTNLASVIPLVSSLLSQLLKQPSITSSSDFPRHVQEIIPMFDHYKTPHDCPFIRLWAILETLLPQLPAFTLIVDALDECQGVDDNDDLLKCLHGLSELPNARTIVLSRYHSKFEEPFSNAIRIPVTPDVVSADIERFVEEEVDRQPLLQGIKEKLLQRIDSDCQGMFLWARMMIDCLARAKTHNAQERALSSFPLGLDNVYEKLLADTARTLEASELALRREIFLIVVAAARPLSLTELSHFVAYKAQTSSLDEKDLFLDPFEAIQQLCWPLVRVANGHVEMVHMSVKDFLTRSAPKNASLKISLSEGNEYLAKKTLAKLNEIQYREPTLLARFIRKHAHPDGYGAEELDIERGPHTDVLYKYACQHWQMHICQVDEPGDFIVRHLGNFMTSNQFVCWAEVFYALNSADDMSILMRPQSALRSWVTLLPPRLRSQIPLQQFCVGPYHKVAESFRTFDDKLLPYLALKRLGEFCNLSGRVDESYGTRHTVAAGLTEMLGANHPLTLQARSVAAIEAYAQGDHKNSYDLLLDISKRQLEILGPERPDSFLSLQYAAVVAFIMTRFQESAENQARAQAGLWRTLGPLAAEVLKGQMFRGWAMEALGQFSEAIDLYGDIYKIWTSTLTIENSKSTYVQCSLAAALRKRGRGSDLDRARVLLEENIHVRQRLFGTEAAIVADSILQLALTYRTLGKLDDARGFLSLVDAPWVTDKSFERKCEIGYMKALLALDEEDKDEAVSHMEGLLHESTELGRDSNNRTLMWLRLTLADLLRKRNEPDAASSLFSDLVKKVRVPSTSTPPAEMEGMQQHEEDESSTPGLSPADSLTGEPEPAAQLRLAETILWHLRRLESAEAKALMHTHQLEWTREMDLWVNDEGPQVDLGYIKDYCHYDGR